MYMLFIQMEKTVLQWAFELNSALSAAAAAAAALHLTRYVAA
jgi:hypothetical protein